jgi:hypothetical protein
VKIAFDVEQAGCESCGKLVRAALEPLGAVEELTIDGGADLARVVLSATAAPDRTAVDAALAGASAGAGHLYRVRADSWRVDIYP